MSRQRLRIVFDAAVFGEQIVGGVSRYFVELQRELVTRPGVDPVVIAGAHANAYLSRGDRRVVGARLNRLPGRLQRRVGILNTGAMGELARLLRPDVVHRTTYRMSPSAKAPSVVTVMDFIHVLLPDFYPDDRYARRQAEAIARADAIVCISESTRSDLIRLLGDPGKPMIVSHLAATGQAPSPQEIEQSVRTRASSPRTEILYVGSRFGYKDFDLVLEALSRGARELDWHLRCVGGPLTTAEQGLVQSMDIARERITTIHASDRELIDLYRTSSMLLYPSRYEGFGLPVLEALAQGCPVICSLTSSLPEAGGEAAIYLEDRTPSKLLELISLVADMDEAQHAEHASRAIAHANRFSWQRTADEHLALYRALQARESRP